MLKTKSDNKIKGFILTFASTFEDRNGGQLKKIPMPPSNMVVPTDDSQIARAIGEAFIGKVIGFNEKISRLLKVTPITISRVLDPDLLNGTERVDRALAVLAKQDIKVEVERCDGKITGLSVKKLVAQAKLKPVCRPKTTIKRQ